MNYENLFLKYIEKYKFKLVLKFWSFRLKIKYFITQKCKKYKISKLQCSIKII